MGGSAIGPVILESREAASGWTRALVRLATIALALGLGGLVLVAAGLPVVESYRAMWNGALGSFSAIAQTLVASTPLMLTGIAVVLAARMGLWNLGGEGQLYMGALFATAVAIWLSDWPRPILVAVMLGAGALGGAVWALGPGLLKAGLRVSEILTTLILNFVAIVLVDFLVDARWRDQAALGFPISRELSDNATMPALLRTAVHGGILIAVAAAFLIWLFLSRTRAGLGTRPSEGKGGTGEGAGRIAARFIVVAMVASGALAGIAGMGEVSGVAHRLHTDISANYGYVGILVAIVSGLSPLGVIVIAPAFGALLVGGFALESLGTSEWVVATLQGTIVAVVLATELLIRYRLRWAGNKPLHKPGPA
jgi:general nucleoside transport system permease protein